MFSRHKHIAGRLTLTLRLSGNKSYPGVASGGSKAEAALLFLEQRSNITGTNSDYGRG